MNSRGILPQSASTAVPVQAMSQPAAPRAVSRVLKQSTRARKRAQAGKAAGRQGCTLLEPDGEVVFQPRLFSSAASMQLLKALQVRAAATMLAMRQPRHSPMLSTESHECCCGASHRGA